MSSIASAASCFGCFYYPQFLLGNNAASAIRLLSRIFEMSSILLFAGITNYSFFPVAVWGLIASLSFYLLSPPYIIIAKSYDRFTTVHWSILITIAAISFVYIAFAMFSLHDFGWEYGSRQASVLEVVLFYLLVVTVSLVCCIYRLIVHVIENDWIPAAAVISTSENTSLTINRHHTESTNNLLSNLISPILVGWLFSSVPYPTAAIICLILTLGISLWVYIILWGTYAHCPILATAPPSDSLDSLINITTCGTLSTSTSSVSSSSKTGAVVAAHDVHHNKVAIGSSTSRGSDWDEAGSKMASVKAVPTIVTGSISTVQLQYYQQQQQQQQQHDRMVEPRPLADETVPIYSYNNNNNNNSNNYYSGSRNSSNSSISSISNSGCGTIYSSIAENTTTAGTEGTAGGQWPLFLADDTNREEGGGELTTRRQDTGSRDDDYTAATTARTTTTSTTTTAAPIFHHKQTSSASSNTLRTTTAVTIRSLRASIPAISYAAIATGAKDMLRSGCFTVMCAYAFSQCTVMNMGSVMMVYMLWAGVSSSILGIYVSLAVLSAYVASSLLYPRYKEMYSVWGTAFRATWVTSLILYLPLLGFMWNRRPVLAILIPTVVSIMGKKLFELNAVSVFESTVSDDRTVVRLQGRWQNMCTMFEMLGFAFVLVLSDPSHFRSLVAFSFVVSVFSSGIFTWVCPPSTVPAILAPVYDTMADTFGFTLSARPGDAYLPIHGGYRCTNRARCTRSEEHEVGVELFHVLPSLNSSSSNRSRRNSSSRSSSTSYRRSSSSSLSLSTQELSTQDRRSNIAYTTTIFTTASTTASTTAAPPPATVSSSGTGGSRHRGYGGGGYQESPAPTKKYTEWLLHTRKAAARQQALEQSPLAPSTLPMSLLSAPPLLPTTTSAGQRSAITDTTPFRAFHSRGVVSGGGSGSGGRGFLLAGARYNHNHSSSFACSSSPSSVLTDNTIGSCCSPIRTSRGSSRRGGGGYSTIVPDTDTELLFSTSVSAPTPAPPAGDDAIIRLAGEACTATTAIGAVSPPPSTTSSSILAHLLGQPQPPPTQSTLHPLLFEYGRHLTRKTNNNDHNNITAAAAGASSSLSSTIDDDCTGARAEDPSAYHNNNHIKDHHYNKKQQLPLKNNIITATAAASKSCSSSTWRINHGAGHTKEVLLDKSEFDVQKFVIEEEEEKDEEEEEEEEGEEIEDEEQEEYFEVASRRFS